MGSTAVGQTYIIDNTYPHGAGQAVASESSSNLIFAGSGSGVLVLNGATAQPTLASVTNNQLRPLGFVRDIAPTPDHLYVAASKSGVVRFNRAGGYTKDWTFADVADAWAVEVVRADATHDVVLAGSNDGDSSGTLRLFLANPTSPTAPEMQDELEFLQPIYTLVSWFDDAEDSWVVLVGTACGKVSTGGSPPALAEAALWRFDFDLSAGPPSTIPAPSSTWAAQIEVSPGILAPVPTFVRDIAIDPEEEVAYAACSLLGLHKLDLSSGGLSEVTNGGWPIFSAAGEAERFTGVALHKPATGEALVAAALGPPLIAERQVWGTCTEPVVCDDGEVGNRASDFEGIKLWDVSAGATLVDEIEVCGPACDLTPVPLKVSVRAESSNAFLLDVASDPHTLQVVKATRSGSTWSLAKVGEWGTAQGFPSSSMDDALQVGPNLYGADENSVVAWDATLTPGGTDLLTSKLALAQAGAVLLSALEGTGAYKTVLFGSAQGGGATFLAPTFDGNGKVTSITNLGTMFPLDPPSPVRCISTFTLQPDQTPDGKPWLLLVSNADSDTLAGCGTGNKNGSLRLYRLEKNAQNVVLPNLAATLGTYLPKPCEANDEDGVLIDAVMVPSGGGGNEFAVWATYGPVNAEVGAGLLVLKATYFSSTGSVRFAFIDKVEAFATAANNKIGRIRYPSGIANTAVAAFGCEGIAAFNVSSPLGVTVASGDIWSGSSLGACALQASELTAGGYFYVTFLNKGIGQFDPSIISSGPSQPLITMPYQPNAIIDAPSGVTGQPAFFVADGRGGMHHLQILQE